MYQADKQHQHQTAVSQAQMFLKAFLIINYCSIIFSKHFLIEVDDNNGTSNIATMDDYPNIPEGRAGSKHFLIVLCFASYFDSCVF